MAMERLEKRVLQYLAQNFYPPTTAAQVAQVLKLDVKQAADILASLSHQGVLSLKDDRYYFNSAGNLVAGRYQAHARGYGFIHTDGSCQYYVPPGTTQGARDGDTLLAQVQARHPGKAPLAKVVEVLFRVPNFVVANFNSSTGLGNVQHGNRKYMIPSRHSRGAQHGEPVVVEISGWEARVVERLPDKDNGRVDLLSIAAQRGILPFFPQSVEEELQSLHLDWDLTERTDLRHLDVVTVDGEGAMDLDDGFSLTKTADGGWQLGIHIADVAHYVQPGTELDQEAARRGQTTYLLDREIPMLPSSLAQDVCSLHPGQDRLAVSCLVDLSAQGEVQDYRFVESAIRSQGQLTYTQVDEGNCGKWAPMLERATELKDLLQSQRQAMGAAYISLPTTKIELDDQGQPVGLTTRQDGAAKGIIEEFMLLANELAADFLHRQGISFLYRGNAGFQPNREQDINDFIGRWGHQLDMTSALDLQRLLAAIADGQEQTPISRKLARYMQKSRYSLEPLAHFNLAVDRYTHFSSPIRRYADLFCHRLVKLGIGGQRSQELEAQLHQVANGCFFREQVVSDVERECIDLKKLQYLDSHRGKYSGIVTDSTGNGPLVWLENTAEGIVVTGEGRDKLVPGDRVEVTVHKLDYKAKQIFFTLDVDS